MIYVCIAMLLLNIFSPHLEVRAFSIAGAFSAGMFCFYFIAQHTKLLKDKK